MFEKKPKYALVLSGGGARGAYEIGAWKALKELDFKFSAICGVSVGALNAAVIAQDDMELGLRLWSELTIDKVVDVPEGFLVNGKPKFSFKNLAKIGDLNLNLSNIGLDSTPLHNLLKKEINEEKIRKSGIDLGIVTIEITSGKPCEFFLDKIPKGTLVDYLLASASFPAFKRTIINGKHFVDGGMYDNIPHAMAKSRGYKKIIVIDIEGIGVNKKPDIAGTETIYIKTSQKLGSVLDFEPEKAKNAIELGYLDTMKVFERNFGENYFFSLDSSLEREYQKRLFNPEYIKKYSKYLRTNIECTPDNVEDLIRNILPKKQKNTRNILHCLIEAAAIMLDIESLRLYSISELINSIKEKYSEIEKSLQKPTKKESDSFFKRIEDAIEDSLELLKSDKELAKYCPYEYAQLFKKSKTVLSIFPEIDSANIFFSIM